MPKKVHLTDIPSLTFKTGKWTAARRADAVPQLECQGRFCDVAPAKRVDCDNIGIDEYGEILWQCSSDDLQYDFKSLAVQCEGWDRPGDDWVLQGSCGLTYSLKTMQGGERQRYTQTGRNYGQDWFGTLFNVAYYGVLLWILLTFIRSCLGRNGNNGRPARPNDGRGGGGGLFPGFFGPSDGSGSGSGSDSKPGAAPGWSSYVWPAAMTIGGLLLANSMGGRNRFGSNDFDWERRRDRGSSSYSSNYGGGGGSSGVASTSRSRQQAIRIAMDEDNSDQDDCWTKSNFNDDIWEDDCSQGNKTPDPTFFNEVEDQEELEPDIPSSSQGLIQKQPLIKHQPDWLPKQQLSRDEVESLELQARFDDHLDDSYTETPFTIAARQAAIRQSLYKQDSPEPAALSQRQVQYVSPEASQARRQAMQAASSDFSLRTPLSSKAPGDLNSYHLHTPQAPRSSNPTSSPFSTPTSHALFFKQKAHLVPKLAQTSHDRATKSSLVQADLTTRGSGRYTRPPAVSGANYESRLSKPNWLSKLQSEHNDEERSESEHCEMAAADSPLRALAHVRRHEKRMRNVVPKSDYEEDQLRRAALGYISSFRSPDCRRENFQLFPASPSPVLRLVPSLASQSKLSNKSKWRTAPMPHKFAKKNYVNKISTAVSPSATLPFDDEHSNRPYRGQESVDYQSDQVPSHVPSVGSGYKLKMLNFIPPPLDIHRSRQNLRKHDKEEDKQKRQQDCSDTVPSTVSNETAVTSSHFTVENQSHDNTTSIMCDGMEITVNFDVKALSQRKVFDLAEENLLRITKRDFFFLELPDQGWRCAQYKSKMRSITKKEESLVADLILVSADMGSEL